MIDTKLQSRLQGYFGKVTTVSGWFFGVFYLDLCILLHFKIDKKKVIDFIQSNTELLNELYNVCLEILENYQQMVFPINGVREHQFLSKNIEDFFDASAITRAGFKNILLKIS